jgi:site-specific DNA-methyltransferase (adenine-specific)
MELPNKKYQIILADPPWQYQDKNCNGACAGHYSTMSIKEICALPIKELADKDCVLFLWATYPMLPEALQVIKAWGFKYKTIAFQWVKKNRTGQGYFYGLGRWTRGNTEPCLLAVKGLPSRINNAVFQIIEAPIRGHSQKPIVQYSLIESLIGKLPRVELFARASWVGWDVWGNQTQNNSQSALVNTPILVPVQSTFAPQIGANHGLLGNCQGEQK